MIPPDAVLDTILGEIEAQGFASGTSTGQDLAALSVAWELVEYAIGTNLLASGTAGDQCEEHYWPTGWADAGYAWRMIALNKSRLISLDTITIVHELHDCDCGTEDITGCAIIGNHDRSELKLENCAGPGSCLCAANNSPLRVDVCYKAGLYTTVAAFDRSVITALGLLYSWWLDLLDTGGGSAGSGFIDSWRSMDYSESYKFIEKTLLGASPQSAAAWTLLRRFRIWRAVVLRSSYPIQRYRR